jgi:hypothetical protein
MLPVLILAACLTGGSANVTDRFVINVPADKAAAWLQSHPDEVSRAGQCETVSRKGTRAHMRKRTPKGAFEFIGEEKVVAQPGGNRYTYDCHLQQSLRGSVVAYDVTATLTPLNAQQSVVEVRAYLAVDRTRDGPVQKSLDESMSGVKALLQRIR